MLCLYYCAITAQCHSWIFSVFSVAPVKHGSCVGKEERILPLSRKSAILVWQQLNQIWVQWLFSYKSWLRIFYNTAKSLPPKGSTWKLVSFPFLSLLQRKIRVPGLWAQLVPALAVLRHPAHPALAAAPPHGPQLPPLPRSALLKRSPNPPSLLRAAFPLEAQYCISVIPCTNIIGKSVALFQHMHVWESG